MLIPGVVANRREAAGGGGGGVLADFDAATFDVKPEVLDSLNISTSPTVNGLALFSAWFKPTLQTVVLRTVYNSGDGPLYVTHYKNTQGGIGIHFDGPSGIAALWYVQSTSYPWANGEWCHVMFSCDTSDTNKRHVYVNGSDVESTGTWHTYADIDIGWNGNMSIGNKYQQTDQQFYGEMAELYCTNEYLDLSVSTNRDKFAINESGWWRPVSLGADGSSVTGTQPIVYVGGDYSDWDSGTNLGSEGDFTVNGPITAGTYPEVDLP